MAAEMRLTAADDMIKKLGAGGKLPDYYWALIAQADVYARLAQNCTAVGYLAGAELQERQSKEFDLRRRQNEDMASLFDEGKWK